MALRRGYHDAKSGIVDDSSGPVSRKDLGNKEFEDGILIGWSLKTLKPRRRVVEPADGMVSCWPPDLDASCLLGCCDMTEAAVLKY